MDIQGSRLLAARIRAESGSAARSSSRALSDQLRAGDRGIVQDIADTGDIVVIWERGFSLRIDPDTTPFQPLAA